MVQYLGKIIIPANLSVFPMQDETVFYYGFIAIAVIILLIVLSIGKDMLRVTGAFLVFFLFLIPVFMVPASLNAQTFEHRLYLPMLGFLLLLPETFLFKNKFTEGQVFIYSLIALCSLGGKTFAHEQNFNDPYSFWTQAVETSPNSAFAVMHLSEYEDNLDKKCSLIRKAYQLNPKERYINFFYAEMLINSNKRDSILAAEPYLMTEKGITNFHKCDFYLARVAVEKDDYNGAIDHLQQFLKIEPDNSKEGGEANNNLLVLYITTKQVNRVIAQARHMRDAGLPVPQEVVQQYHI
jgi:tetratricopeptide (TPR) repeat protein